MTEPVLMKAKESAELCGVSAASWWRYHAAAKIPNAINLVGNTFWNRQELVAWVAAGCPERDEWEKIKKEAK